MFLNKYRTAIKQSLPIAPFQLRPGMVIETRYKNLQNIQKPYLLLILNESRIEHGKQYCHVLDLNFISPPLLRKILATCNNKETYKNIEFSNWKNIPKVIYPKIAPLLTENEMYKTMFQKNKMTGLRFVTIDIGKL